MFKFLFVFIATLPLGASSVPLDKFHIVTVANKQHPRLNNLKKSCRAQGFDLEIIGMGKPYFKNSTKFVRMQEYVNRLPDDHIVMFIDGFDVIVVQPKAKILDKFLKENSDLTFASERNCWPYEAMASTFTKHPHGFDFINSGCYIGYASKLKAFYKSIAPHPYESDQKYVYLNYFQNPCNFKIDHNCEIFLCLYEVNPDDVALNASNDIQCLPTNTLPCVLHANGYSYAIMDQVFEKLYGAPEQSKALLAPPMQKSKKPLIRKHKMSYFSFVLGSLLGVVFSITLFFLSKRRLLSRSRIQCWRRRWTVF